MFRWYAAADVCYAYLEDVPPGQNPYLKDSAFRNSRWFTRGWTLQELLAPQTVVFYASDWTVVFNPFLFQDFISKETELGHETGSAQATWPETKQLIAANKLRASLLAEITHISTHLRAFGGNLELQSISAACKFAWAAKRNTTRVEDMAYCLMGLMGVNMPLLYSEGSMAFVRLQEAVLGRSDDISMLGWGYGQSAGVNRTSRETYILARSPAAFLGYPAQNLRHYGRIPGLHHTITGHGLHIELPMTRIDNAKDVWLAIIEEAPVKGKHLPIGIILTREEMSTSESIIFRRSPGCPPVCLWGPEFSKLPFKSVYFQDTAVSPVTFVNETRRGALQSIHEMVLDLFNVYSAGFILHSYYPLDGQFTGVSSGQTSVIFFKHMPFFYATFTRVTGKSFGIKLHMKTGKPSYGVRIATITFCAL